MRHIEKGQEPQVFTGWKALENEDWQPTYDDLAGDEKQAVRNALFQEQRGICCYCEGLLTDTDCHIEHCMPQSLDSVNPLDFANMLLSCQNQLSKGAPRHCGNAKGEWYDEQLFVTPLSRGCEGRFAFEANGVMKPAADCDLAAVETIRKLALNISKVRELREAAIEPFLDESLEDEEFLVFLKAYVEVPDEERLNPYTSAVAYIFRGSFGE